MGNVVEGGSFHPETGSTQATGTPSGGCSREWGLRRILLVLPVDELVGLSRGGWEAPKQPAVKRGAVLVETWAGEWGQSPQYPKLGGGGGRGAAVNTASILKIKENE